MSTHEERIRRKPLKSSTVPASVCDEKFMRIALSEAKSAENIAIRKSVNMEEMEMKQYLMKKGYSTDHITEALEKLEE